MTPKQYLEDVTSKKDNSVSFHNLNYAMNRLSITLAITTKHAPHAMTLKCTSKLLINAIIYIYIYVDL